MKTNMLKILAFVLVVVMGGILVVCNTLQEDRPLPALQTATEIETDGALPVPTNCEFPGTVIQFPGMEDECGINILLDNGELLYPYSLMVEFDFEAGQRVEVSYDQLDVLIPNCKGIPVAIYCARLLEEEPPVDPCMYKARIIDRKIDEFPYNIEIQLQNGEILYPLKNETEFVMKDGQFVRLGFEVIAEPNTSDIGGVPVMVTCMRLRSPDPDEDLKPVLTPELK